MQNQYAIEAADSTSEPREVAILHIDKKQSVIHESLTDLTGESASNRTWMFVNDTYLAIENQYQSGTRLMTEGTQEYVTTESFAGLHLWQNFHDLLISSECISNSNSNLDPLELCVSLFETESHESEMQKVRDIIRSPETSFISKMEVMKSLLARNSTLQNWLLCLNLKRHANKEQATQHLILTIMEQAATASCYSEVNLSKFGEYYGPRTNHWCVSLI